MRSHTSQLFTVSVKDNYCSACYLNCFYSQCFLCIVPQQKRSDDTRQIIRYEKGWLRLQEKKCFFIWSYMFEHKPFSLNVANDLQNSFKRLLPLPSFHFKLPSLLHIYNIYTPSVYFHIIPVQRLSTNRFPKWLCLSLVRKSIPEYHWAIFTPEASSALNLPCFKCLCSNHYTSCKLICFLIVLGRNTEQTLFPVATSRSCWWKMLSHSGLARMNRLWFSVPEEGNNWFFPQAHKRSYCFVGKHKGRCVSHVLPFAASSVLKGQDYSAWIWN